MPLPTITKARMVTLAQLAIMPIGTWVSPVKMEHDEQCMHASAVFDIQGILRVGALSRVVAIDSFGLMIRAHLPDILVREGRLVTQADESTYALPGWAAHRFIVWQ